MSAPGRCVICTLNLRSDVSALRCGHTFHMECIHRWIDQARTCPTCRKRTQTKDIIKLFFDAPDVDLMSQTSTPEEQIARLGNALDTAKAEHAQTLKELQALMKRILELESRLKTEKKKSESLGMYQEKNRHLEHMLQDQQQLKDRLKKCEDRLKASDFYILLKTQTLSDRSIEEKIDKYLKESGEIHEANFLKLLRNQLKDLEKKYTNVMRDLHKVDVENKELKNKAVQYKKEIAGLKKGGAELHGVVRPASDTTFCTSPAKTPPRKSFGFPLNDSETYFGDLLHSLDRERKKANLHAEMAHESSGSKKRQQIVEFNFESPEKENDQVAEPKKRRIHKEPPVQIRFEETALWPTTNREIEIDQPSTSAHQLPVEDVQIPTPIVKRAISLPKKTNPLFSSSRNVETSKAPTPAQVSVRTVSFKRTNSGNSSSSKQSTKTAKPNKKDMNGVKSMRLSQFFPRTKSNATIECVEIRRDSQDIIVLS